MEKHDTVFPCSAATNTDAKQQSKQVHVRVGVGVLVKDPTTATTTSTTAGGAPAPAAAKVFAGFRRGSHGAGSLALPGGHLELFETWENCARREVKEEMNLDLDRSTIRFAHVTNDIMESEQKHYVTIFMMAECQQPSSRSSSGNGDSSSLSSPSPCMIPQNMEPDKCEGWNSYTWQELREINARGQPGLFGPLKRLVEDAPESVQRFLATSS